MVQRIGRDLDTVLDQHFPKVVGYLLWSTNFLQIVQTKDHWSEPLLELTAGQAPAAASRARASIPAQSCLATLFAGATQLPPTQSTFCKAR